MIFKGFVLISAIFFQTVLGTSSLRGDSSLLSTAEAAKEKVVAHSQVNIVLHRDRKQEHVAELSVLLKNKHVDNNMPNFHAEVAHEWNNLAMLSASVSEEALDFLKAHPDVLLVHPVTQVKVDVRDAAEASSPKSWGLDRIDQPNLPLDKAPFDPNPVLKYGKNVRVYVIDSGLQTNHVEFANKKQRVVQNLWSYFGDRGVDNDGDGHGTHVAATVGGINTGVAKNANIYALKVLDDNGNGDSSGVISAIDYVRGLRKSNPKWRMVATASLGTSVIDPAIDAAVNSLVMSGVSFTVATGNSNTDSCMSSPSSAALSIGVGASTRFDARADYSNYGTCTKIIAPGSDIVSACSSKTTLGKMFCKNGKYMSISGTSMATPHAAGTIALILSNPKVPPVVSNDIMLFALQCLSVPNVISDARGPNNLLQIPIQEKAMECLKLIGSM